MKRILKLFTLLLFTFSTSAKDLNVAIFLNQFLNTNGETYVETYFSLDPRSVVLVETDKGTFQGAIEITLTFETDSQIVAFDKLLLTSPEIADSNQFMPYSVQQSRLKLDRGEYTMKVQLADVTKPDEPVSLEEDIRVEISRTDIQTSSILLLDSYKQSDQSSVVGKWGYELVPIVPVGTYFIPDNIENLPFYCEVFNTDTVLGDNEPYLIKYYLYDNMRQTEFQQFSGFQRASGSVVNPVLNTFNIKSLPSGYYDLVLEVVDKNNTKLADNRVSFYRKNLAADMNAFDMEQVLLENTFVEGISNLDSMFFYIDCLYPISNSSERRIEQNLLASPDIEKMQKFFLTYWNRRSPTNPQGVWTNYRKQVAHVQDQFGTHALPGYKTDMGRVFLQYGRPSTIERSPRNGYNYPWQMWQYDQLLTEDIPRQTNRIFVFVDQTLTGRSYTLIHSNAISEIQDYKWKYQLQRNTNRGNDVDDTSTQNGRNPYGDKVDNNFIIGDQRFWYDRN